MKRRSAVIFGILTILLLCFIWGQSLLPQDKSAGESRFVMQFLKPLLDPSDRIDADLFHHLLRKTAHFTEYAALGLCACGLSCSFPWKRRAACAAAPILLCAFAAAADETIQLFSAGRGPQVRDVLLDCSGALFGIAIYALLLRLKRRRSG